MHRYDVIADKWSRAPALSKPRVGHASCALGDNIYVFCGGVMNNTDDSYEIIEPDPDNSIEWLDARALISGGNSSVAWQTIQVPASSNPLSARFLPVVSPLNAAEIAILGGDSSVEGVNMLLGDILIFNTASSTVTSVQVRAENLRFQSSSNLSVTSQADQIAALVMTSEGKFHLVSYKKGQDAVEVIKSL